MNGPVCAAEVSESAVKSESVRISIRWGTCIRRASLLTMHNIIRVGQNHICTV